MGEIFALVEHRQGAIRDITYEILACGRKIAEKKNTQLTALLLGHDTDSMIESLKSQAHRVLICDHEIYKNFNAETYQITLNEILRKHNPLLTLIGHTACGYDLCPALAAQLDWPFSTDCLDLEFKDSQLHVIRQVFDGKINCNIVLREQPSYIITLRSGGFPPEEANLTATIEKYDPPITAQPDYRKFIEYIEAATGDVDITKAEIVVSIGRGIKEETNLAMIQDFAESLNGVVACSRPVVDAGWLPKERQVGSSGKTIKPKLYIALGISGAFQHVVGMKGADTIIAINKDENAPIFNEADFGIVDDLFKVIPALKAKIEEVK